jgi:RNA polymerase sigma-70 factor (ECF subfamily)
MLIQRHNHRVVLSLLGNGIALDRAKDLAQEAWTRLMEQQRRGQLDRLQLPGLAITQASFLAKDSRRRELRAVPDDPSAALVELPNPAAGSEERYLTHERLDRALKVLASCPPSSQRVFKLFYEDPSIPHAQLAELVGLSVQRVRQIICEVRRTLRDAIEEPVS